MSTVYSWGRTFLYDHEVRRIDWRSEGLGCLSNGDPPALPHAYGRSYGDSCLNDDGILLDTRGMNRFIAFDRDLGILRCEGGVSLADILEVIVPAGWYLPVSPGTKFVSVAGAIANDVHGKNHHSAGTFGCHVRRFELIRSDGTILECSPDENAEFFRATIGGMGLTGLITWVEFSLERIVSPEFDVEVIRFGNLDEFFALSAESNSTYAHIVSWVDCLATGANVGRGLFFRGNHTQEPNPSGLANSSHSSSLHPTVPIDLPGFLLNPTTMKLFNTAVFHQKRTDRWQGRQHFDQFYYPLDGVNQWNRAYGRRGFFQYQFVLPDGSPEVMRPILSMLLESGSRPFLNVFKEFGDVESPGMMSFPMPGVTFAIDFPNRGEATEAVFRKLDDIVGEHGGRVYPAKDAVQSASLFKQSYPQWEQFSEYIDPKFSSSLWRRMTTA